MHTTTLQALGTVLLRLNTFCSEQVASTEVFATQHLALPTVTGNGKSTAIKIK